MGHFWEWIAQYRQKVPLGSWRMTAGTNGSCEEVLIPYGSKFFSSLSGIISINITRNRWDPKQPHKISKSLSYGVRGIILFFLCYDRVFPLSKKGVWKNFRFSHALFLLGIYHAKELCSIFCKTNAQRNSNQQPDRDEKGQKTNSNAQRIILNNCAYERNWSKRAILDCNTEKSYIVWIMR